MPKAPPIREHIKPEVLGHVDSSVFGSVLSLLGPGKRISGVYYYDHNELNPWNFQFRPKNEMTSKELPEYCSIFKKYIFELKEKNNIKGNLFSGILHIDTTAVSPGETQKNAASSLHIEAQNTIIGFSCLPTVVKNSVLAQEIGSKHYKNLPSGKHKFIDDNLSEVDVRLLNAEPELDIAENSYIFLPGITPHKSRPNTLNTTVDRVYFQIFAKPGSPRIIMPKKQ